MEEIFTAKHPEFYWAFEKWRKEMHSQGKPVNGVYILYANKPVCRLADTDELGTLYIGKGVILNERHRVGKLINAVNKTEGMHSGGVRLQNEKVLNKYPVVNMTLKIILCENETAEESKRLKDYEFEYGELPPFNRQGGI